MEKSIRKKYPRGFGNRTYVLILFVCIMFFLRDYMGFPSGVTYATDAILIFLFLMDFGRIKKAVLDAKAQTVYNVFLVLLFCMVIGVVVNFVAPRLVIWSLRNNLRLYLFFLICVAEFTEENLDRLLKILNALFWINVVFCTFQYFAEGLSGDTVGGLFGRQAGSTTYINIMICIMTCVILGKYAAYQTTFPVVMAYIGACLYLSILSELKVYYIEMFIIFAFVAIYTESKRRVAQILIFCAGAVVVCILVLIRFSPETMAVFTSQRAANMYLAGNGYTNAGDLNRVTALQSIYRQFFTGNPFRLLFGFGAGYCEHSAYSIFESPFYVQYGYLNYRWFTHAWIFLEQGAIGLTLMVLFFVSMIFYAMRHREIRRKDLMMAGVSFVPICILSIFYNSSLQTESSYLLAFMCAIPFALVRENNEVEIEPGIVLNYITQHYEEIRGYGRSIPALQSLFRRSNEAKGVRGETAHRKIRGTAFRKRKPIRATSGETARGTGGAGGHLAAAAVRRSSGVPDTSRAGGRGKYALSDNEGRPYSTIHLKNIRQPYARPRAKRNPESV